jgi:hydroxypyruvate isomerase
MFIRYYLSETKAKDRVKELIEFCKRTGCEGVLFFSSSYDSMPSFIKIEEYRKYAEKLKILVEKIKNEGLKFGINILQSLGHIYFPE